MHICIYDLCTYLKKIQIFIIIIQQISTRHQGNMKDEIQQCLQDFKTQRKSHFYNSYQAKLNNNKINLMNNSFNQFKYTSESLYCYNNNNYQMHSKILMVPKRPELQIYTYNDSSHLSKTFFACKCLGSTILNGIKVQCSQLNKKLMVTNYEVNVFQVKNFVEKLVQIKIKKKTQFCMFCLFIFEKIFDNEICQLIIKSKNPIKMGIYYHRLTQKINSTEQARGTKSNLSSKQERIVNNALMSLQQAQSSNNSEILLSFFVDAANQALIMESYDYCLQTKGKIEKKISKIKLLKDSNNLFMSGVQLAQFKKFLFQINEFFWQKEYSTSPEKMISNTEARKQPIAKRYYPYTTSQSEKKMGKNFLDLTLSRQKKQYHDFQQFPVYYENSPQLCH